MPQTPQNCAYTEANIEAAMSAYRKDEYNSIRAAAEANSVPESTLRSRLSGRNTRVLGHRNTMILSVR